MSRCDDGVRAAARRAFGSQTLVSMPPRPISLPAPPAIASIAGSPPGFLHQRGLRILARIGGE